MLGLKGCHYASEGFLRIKPFKVQSCELPELTKKVFLYNL